MADTTADKSPAYAYGRYVSVLFGIVQAMGAVDENRARQWRDRLDDLETKAVESVARLPGLETTARQWLRDLRRAGRGDAADARATDLEEWGAKVAEWAWQRRGNPRLTIEERLAFYIGLSTGRQAYRPTSTV